MATSPTFSFFQRELAPTNLLTVAEFRRFANALGLRSWESGAKRYARQTGGALVLRADDALVVFTKSGDSVLRRTFKKGSWGWAS